MLFLIIYAAEAVYMLPLRYWDMSYKRAHGMVKTTCCGFLINQLVRYLMMVILGEIPALYLASMILVGTGKYFFIAAFGGTMLAMIFLIYIMPSLSCFAIRFSELPEEENDLKAKIQEFLSSRGDSGCRVLMMKKLDGNLHSNAMMTKGDLYLTESLLEHLRGYPDEIISIVGHEHGHKVHKD